MGEREWDGGERERDMSIIQEQTQIIAFPHCFTSKRENERDSESGSPRFLISKTLMI